MWECGKGKEGLGSSGLFPRWEIHWDEVSMEPEGLGISDPALHKRAGSTPRPKSEDSSSEEPPWRILPEIPAVLLDLS